MSDEISDERVAALLSTNHTTQCSSQTFQFTRIFDESTHMTGSETNSGAHSVNGDVLLNGMGMLYGFCDV